MAELIMREVLDRLGVVLLPEVYLIVVSAQQSGAVQFFLIPFTLRFFRKSDLAEGNLLLGSIFKIFN